MVNDVLAFRLLPEFDPIVIGIAPAHSSFSGGMGQVVGTQAVPAPWCTPAQADASSSVQAPAVQQAPTASISVTSIGASAVPIPALARRM